MNPKLFYVAMALAVAGGLFAGWAQNHNRYGRYPSRFGAYEIGGEVTPENVSQHVLLTENQDSGARANVEDSTTHDFGVMSVGSQGDHTFVLRNIGTAPLTLRVGRTTCKCTLGELASNSVEPGEETEIKLSWIVKSNATQFGQEAEIHTNDPNHAVIPFKVQGQVIREFELTPDIIDVGLKSPSEGIQAETTVYSFSEYEIAPTGAGMLDDATDALAEVTFEELDRDAFDEKFRDQANQAFLIRADIKPGMPQGKINANIRFGFVRKNDSGEGVAIAEIDPRQTDMTIPPPALDADADPETALLVPIRGQIVGTLGMMRNTKVLPLKDGTYRLDVGTIPAGETTEFSAFVTIKGDRRNDIELEIESISPKEFVTAEFGSTRDGSQTTLAPLKIIFTPPANPEKTLDYRGLSGDTNDYGRIVLKSKSDDGAKMVLYLKFLVE